MPADPTMPPPALPAFLEPALPFRRRFVRTRHGRIHVVDEGEGPAVLLVHGNPTWSYLWRKVIPLLSARGLRVVAPDLFGFGLSDKPPEPSDHRLEDHLQAIAEVIDGLGLEELVVVGQDWGGPISVGGTMRSKARAVGLVLGNTAVLAPPRPFRPKPFHKLSHVPVLSDALFVGAGFPLGVLHRTQADKRSIGRDERRAYRYPFRYLRDRAGPLGLARMVPNAEEHPSVGPLDEIDAWVRGLHVPTALVWGRRDPILGAALGRHRRAFPTARVIEADAGHFLQEEVPEMLADAIAEVAERAAGEGAAAA